MTQYIVFMVGQDGRYYTARDHASVADALKYYERMYGNGATYTLVGVYPRDQAAAEGMPASRSKFDEWVKANKHKFITSEASPITQTQTAPGPRKPQPVICPEVWAAPRKDVDYMAAVRDMCKGV
jgi:hypothetical protein